jgi:16S rRNA (guanine966-N2)-methyltransferase
MSRVVSKKTSRANTGAAYRLRIIGGRWRGTRIDFPHLEAIRPSPDRVRETLFNWLQSWTPGARCLDLFAGSGALGLEALSRGAAHVTFVDREPKVGRHLAQTLERLKSNEADVHVADALSFLKKTPPHPYDIVFLDPPFASALLEQACPMLAAGWVSRGGHIYIETPADQALPALPAGWSVHRTRQAGQVGYHLLRTDAATAGDPS